MKIAICNTQSDVLEKDPQIVSRASQYLKNPEYRRAFEAGNISQLPDNVRYDLDIMDHLFYLDGIKKLDVYSPLRQEVDPDVSKQYPWEVSDKGVDIDQLEKFHKKYVEFSEEPTNELERETQG